MEVSLPFVLLLISLIGALGELKTYENIEPAYMQDPMPSFMCLSKSINDSYGLILSHTGADESPYADDLDCLFTINTARGRRINLRFDFFDMQHSYDQDSGRCQESGDRFAIYESGQIFLIKNDDLQPERTVCGGTGSFPEDYQSVGNIITVRLITDTKSSQNKGLQFLYSSFLSPEEGGEDCFNCEDSSMCIDKSLKCDGITQCNDDSDELSCADVDIWTQLVDEYGFTTVVVVLAAAVVAAVLILVLCICCCCCCCCGRRRKETLQEQKQYQRAPNKPRSATPPVATAPYPHTQDNNTPNYASYNSSHGRPQPPSHPGGYHTGYTPNGHSGYQAVYNPANNTNGGVPYPHQV